MATKRVVSVKDIGSIAGNVLLLFDRIGSVGLGEADGIRMGSSGLLESRHKLEVEGYDLEVITYVQRMILGHYAGFIYVKLQKGNYIWMAAFDSLNMQLPDDSRERVKRALVRQIYGKGPDD